MTGTSVTTATRVVLSAARALDRHSEELCRLDAAAGDGDHGLAMGSVAKAIETRLSASEPTDLAALTELVAAQFAAAGGSMGALMYVLMSAVAATIDPSEPFSASTIARPLAAGQAAVTDFGGATPGDKTMIDALDAARAKAVECARANLPATETMPMVAAAAQAGAERTAQLVARVGRASRLGEQSLGTVDPGAQTIAIMLDAVAQEYAAVASPVSCVPTRSRAS